MNFLIVVFTFLFINQTYAGISFGKCPVSPVISDFDPTKYIGVWYEIERITGPYEFDLKCVTATYGLKDNGKVSVKNQGIFTITNKISEIEAEASAPNPQEPNKLIVQFPFGQGTYDLWYTDYTNVALVYSCTPILGLKYENMWILSRKPTLEQTTVDKLKALLKSENINISSFEKVTQDC